LYPDGKKRAMLRSFRLAMGQYPDDGFLLPASNRYATFTHFIAGPLCAMHPITDKNPKIKFCYYTYSKKIT
jgi:hypothetical protein